MLSVEAARTSTLTPSFLLMACHGHPTNIHPRPPPATECQGKRPLECYIQDLSPLQCKNQKGTRPSDGVLHHSDLGYVSLFWNYVFQCSISFSLYISLNSEYRGKLGYNGQIFNRIGGAGGFHHSISRDEKNLIGANDVIESSQRGNDPPFHKTAVSVIESIWSNHWLRYIGRWSG